MRPWSVTFDETAGAYRNRAEEYTELLGSMEATAAEDRMTIRSWASEQRGLLVDVGCGPGHWTKWLDDLRREGALPEVSGIDGVEPVEAFVTGARGRAPALNIHRGVAEHLPYDDASVGGILAWYSLIHTAPARLGDALGEFARVLRPGGGLCIGFFEGSVLEPFDHAVTPAMYWPLQELATRIESAGFEIVGSGARQDPGVRRHGHLIARHR